MLLNLQVVVFSIDVSHETSYEYFHIYYDLFGALDHPLQTLRLKYSDNQGGWKISGNYSAIVSNDYGTNESRLHVYYKCECTLLFFCKFSLVYILP